MTFTLGFSPCPNDTFIFDALVNNKIDTGHFKFKVLLEDVQTLNQWAIEEKLAITKISYGALPLINNNYILLTAGGALGKGVGPLLIAKEEITDPFTKINNLQVAIPGTNTTAHLLFSLAFPQASNKIFMLFSAIEEAILQNTIDAGVIIHENRFTYQQKGLKKIIDLGDYWHQQTQLPIPLGAIAINRNIDKKIQHQVNSLIYKSIEYAFYNYPFIANYVKQHAQEMDENIIKQHIDLYVNKYSLNLGIDGKKAVNKLLNIYQQTNQQTVFINENIFI